MRACGRDRDGARTGEPVKSITGSSSGESLVDGVSEREAEEEGELFVQPKSTDALTMPFSLYDLRGRERSERCVGALEAEGALKTNTISSVNTTLTARESRLLHCR